MVTPAGNIGLSDVNIELRKSSNTNTGLDDADVRALARISSGDIGLTDLQSKSIVNWVGTGIIEAGPSPVIASYTFFNNGSGWSFLTSSGLGSDYQIRAEQISAFGVATRTGTLNTWESLSTARTWSIETFTLGAKDWVLSISIREAGGSQPVVATGELNMTVEVV